MLHFLYAKRTAEKSMSGNKSKSTTRSAVITGRIDL
jgi:hypothetical protein